MDPVGPPGIPTVPIAKDYHPVEPAPQPVVSHRDSGCCDPPDDGL